MGNNQPKLSNNTEYSFQASDGMLCVNNMGNGYELCRVPSDRSIFIVEYYDNSNIFLKDRNGSYIAVDPYSKKITSVRDSDHRSLWYVGYDENGDCYFLNRYMENNITILIHENKILYHIPYTGIVPSYSIFAPKKIDNIILPILPETRVSPRRMSPSRMSPRKTQTSPGGKQYGGSIENNTQQYTTISGGRQYGGKIENNARQYTTTPGGKQYGGSIEKNISQNKSSPGGKQYSGKIDNTSQNKSLPGGREYNKSKIDENEGEIITL